MLYPVAIRTWAHCSQRRVGHSQQQYSCRLRYLNDAHLILSGSKCDKKKSPTPLHQQQQIELLIQRRMGPYFHVAYTKFWLYHLKQK